MKVIVPMAGIGRRFVRAGYTEAKPLIGIYGKTMIERVCDMFPGEEDYLFICNKTHLENTNMRAILKSLKPKCEIITLHPHRLGPVHSLMCAQHFIPDDEECIVTYCDFGGEWDYPGFLKGMRDGKYDGGLLCFKGFHPCSLGDTYYAYVDVNPRNEMKSIKEKTPISPNRMDDFASNGTHYFRTGSILKKYCQNHMDLKREMKGEYYVSEVFNGLVEDGLRVLVYPMNKVFCWGTPYDVEEYLKWARHFEKIEPKILEKEPMAMLQHAYWGDHFSKMPEHPRQ